MNLSSLSLAGQSATCYVSNARGVPCALQMEALKDMVFLDDFHATS